MSAPGDGAIVALVEHKSQTESRLERIGRSMANALIPVVGAFVIGGLLLAVLGRNPFAFYGNVIDHGLIGSLGRQETLIRMAPLLLIAAGLMIAFPAGIWNLGTDGQYVMGGVIVAALGPELAPHVSGFVLFTTLFIVGFVVAAIWSLIPAILKAWYGINEIISTLMLTFIGLRFSAFLVKEYFYDRETTVPQTRVLAVADRLPRMFSSRVHIGLIVGLVAVIAVHFVMRNTAFGLRLRIVGMNPKAAIHAGMNMKALTIAIFTLSAGFAGLAAAVNIAGVDGVVRAEWNPAVGLLVVPLVFLARFHAASVIAFIAAFAVFQVGGESASRKADIPNFMVLFMVGLLLIFMALGEYMQLRSSRKHQS